MMNGMTNENTISGRVTHVLELVSGDSKRRPGEKWYRQEYVIETMEEYPKSVCFELWGEDRIKQANIQEGDFITVSFNVQSREYNGRWYTSVRGRFVTKGDPNAMSNPGMGMPQQPGAPMGGFPQQNQQGMPGTNNNFGGQDPNDDLPF